MGEKKSSRPKETRARASSPGKARPARKAAGRAAGARGTGSSAGESKPAGRRTLKHTDALLAMPLAGRAAFLEAASIDELIDIFEQSFPSVLVNFLLDMKKSSVKRILEMVADERRRAVAETATLYYYREYLTNPLPLRIEAGAGISLPNFYAILGVPRDATEDELREAHRLLSRAHAEEFFSPDMAPAAAERRTEIDDAYANLRTPEKRVKADRLLPNVTYLYPRRDQAWLESVHRLIR